MDSGLSRWPWRRRSVMRTESSKLSGVEPGRPGTVSTAPQHDGDAGSARDGVSITRGPEVGRSWLTVREVADDLGVSTKTIRRRMADGLLAYHQPRARYSIRVARQALDDYLKTSTQAAAQEGPDVDTRAPRRDAPDAGTVSIGGFTFPQRFTKKGR